MKKINLVYYTDALCGWCYGFSPIMEKIYTEFNQRIDFDVVSGGLFLDNRAGLVNDVAPHIKAGAYKRVEEITGVKFGKCFIDSVFGDGKLTLDSLYPAIALCVVKEKMPDKAIQFTSLLLSAYYYDGLDSTDIDGHGRYFRQIGLDEGEAITLSKSETYYQLAVKDFERFRRSDVSVFPSLVIEQNDSNRGHNMAPIVLSNGSMTYDALHQELSRILSLK
jgi:putative protein-disulfide isomerase